MPQVCAEAIYNTQRKLVWFGCAFQFVSIHSSEVKISNDLLYANLIFCAIM